MRWGSGRKRASPCATAVLGVESARTAASAAAALSRLCRPWSPMPSSEKRSPLDGVVRPRPEAHEPALAASRLGLAHRVARGHDRDVGSRLVDEGVALGVGVGLKARIAVEVVLRHVEQHADLGTKLRRAFELK